MSTCEVNTIKERTTTYIEIKSPVYLNFEIVVLFQVLFCIFLKNSFVWLKKRGDITNQWKTSFHGQPRAIKQHKAKVHKVLTNEVKNRLRFVNVQMNFGYVNVEP